MTETSTFESSRLIRVGADGFAPKPYAHQIAASDALTRAFKDEKKGAGLLIVPTGGGKTVIAAKWLLENWVAHGGRVLWLAHRRELVRQALTCFENLRSHAQPKSQLGLIAISSDDCSWPQVSNDVDVVFCSTPTAVRSASLGFIDALRHRSELPLFVVLDEAHHAAAPQISELLRTLRRWKCPLLGLTATPVRMNDVDQRRLVALFDSNKIYEMRRSTLVEAEVLAVPRPDTVRTSVNFERDFNAQDKAHLARFGEISERVLACVAKHAGRNKLIVDHYVKNSAKYGSTIVFAANTEHAHTLTVEFKAAGVDCDYVTYSRADSSEIIRRYREQKTPRVLVNVEMLTEGFDAPHTRTVFLVRPTKSEALLTQMVGRALRGPKAGGNKEAHLVTFVDTWSQFSPLDTEYVLGTAEDVAVEVNPAEPREVVRVPIELVNEAYRLLQTVATGIFEGVFDCLPNGWYVWEELLDDDVQRRVVMVYEHQIEGFRAMLADYPSGEGLPPVMGEDFGLDVLRRYFPDTPDPLPRWSELLALLEAQRGKLQPEHYTFEEKVKFDPRSIAEQSLAENLGVVDLARRTQEIWETSAACRLVYRGDYRTFHNEVTQALSPPSATPPVRAETVELVPKTLRVWPAGEAGHSLIGVRDSVLSQKIHFPKGPPLLKDLTWSRREVRGYWGIFRPSDKSIVINTVLNSPDVPQFVLEYLLYHELLHADMLSAGHNASFRERERRFVPSHSATEQAIALGFKPGVTRDAWYVLADIFLGTFERIYSTAGERRVSY